MYLKMAKRVLFETDKRLVWKLAWNMGFKGVRSIERHKRRLKRGEYFPPFLYVSVINSCNLRCQGCWVDVSHKQEKISLDAMTKLIDEAKEMGNVFFGIVGGEPFLHDDLLEIFRRHPDCYFQVFTNGQFITDEVARELRHLGNVTPLISVEGTEIVSDERRGQKDVLSRTMQGIRSCLDNKLLTGVCTSLCQTNIDDLLTEEWIDRLIEMGFRPFAPDGSPASLNFWVPLTRATPRNGCMYAVPRSKDGCYNNTDCEAHFGYLHGTTNNRVPGAGGGRAFPDNFTAGFSLQDVRALPRVPGEVMAWDGQLLHWGGRVSGHTGVEMTPDNGGGGGGGGDNDRISIAFEFQRADWPSMNMFSNPVLLPGVDMPFAERLETIARQFRNFVHIRSNRGPGLELLSAMVPKLLEQRRAAAESAEKAVV